MKGEVVVWASRKVAVDGDRQIQLKFDAGDWLIEVWEGPEKKTTGKLAVPPEAMDQLVAEWPTIRAQVGK